MIPNANRYVCPVCGLDCMNGYRWMMRDAHNAIERAGLTHVGIGPGGRQFDFKDGRRLYLEEYCATQDKELVRKFFEPQP